MAGGVIACAQPASLSLVAAKPPPCWVNAGAPVAPMARLHAPPGLTLTSDPDGHHDDDLADHDEDDAEGLVELWQGALDSAKAMAPAALVSKAGDGGGVAVAASPAAAPQPGIGSSSSNMSVEELVAMLVRFQQHSSEQGAMSFPDLQSLHSLSMMQSLLAVFL